MIRAYEYKKHSGLFPRVSEKDEIGNCKKISLIQDVEWVSVPRQPLLTCESQWHNQGYCLRKE